MAESLSEMLVFQKLIEGKSSFDINALYAPILIIMIIWYLLNQNNNLCSNCKNTISSAPLNSNVQYKPQIQYPYMKTFTEKMREIEFNPY